MARALANGDVWQLQGIVNDYVIGYFLRTVTAEAMEAALPGNLRNRTTIDRFELGLQTVFDGIERRFLE